MLTHFDTKVLNLPLKRNNVKLQIAVPFKPGAITCYFPSLRNYQPGN